MVNLHNANICCINLRQFQWLKHIIQERKTRNVQFKKITPVHAPLTVNFPINCSFPGLFPWSVHSFAKRGWRRMARQHGQMFMEQERRIINISPLTTHGWWHVLLPTHIFPGLFLFWLQLYCLSHRSLKYLTRREKSFYPQAVRGGAWSSVQHTGKFSAVTCLVLKMSIMLCSAPQCSRDYFNV